MYYILYIGGKVCETIKPNLPETFRYGRKIKIMETITQKI